MLKATAVQKFKSTFVVGVRTPTKKKLTTILRENAIRQEIIDKKNVVPKFIPEIDPETENNLTLSDPIPPSYSNLIKKTKEILYPEAVTDHPLWKFFPDKKLVRSTAHLDTKSREWTVPELRIKSFNDLHYIYISCLMEINSLNRELAYLDPARGLDYLYVDKKPLQSLRTKLSVTMNNIKSVLKDRKFAHDMAKFELVDRHIFKELDYDFKEFQLLKANKDLYQKKCEEYIEMEKQRLLSLKEGEDIEEYENRLNMAFKFK